ncbi:hypothetical protein QL285_052506 [Trifolium repens]|nr:hypothetical protein QL285_052506 [Trifolium repens]
MVNVGSKRRSLNVIREVEVNKTSGSKEINLFSLTPTPSRQQQQQHHHLPSSFTPNQHAIIDSCSLGSRLHVKSITDQRN